MVKGRALIIRISTPRRNQRLRATVIGRQLSVVKYQISWQAAQSVNTF